MLRQYGIRGEDGRTLILYRISLQSIVVAHFVVDLRQIYLADSHDTSFGTRTVSPLRFATTVLGNLGAPLCTVSGPSESAYWDASEWRRPRSSPNPLAVGLLGCTEQTILLSPRLVWRYAILSGTNWALRVQYFAVLSPKPLVDDVFEDVEYGERLLALVRRGDTGDTTQDTPTTARRDCVKAVPLGPRTRAKPKILVCARPRHTPASSDHDLTPLLPSAQQDP